MEERSPMTLGAVPHITPRPGILTPTRAGLKSLFATLDKLRFSVDVIGPASPYVKARTDSSFHELYEPVTSLEQ